MSDRGRHNGRDWTRFDVKIAAKLKHQRRRRSAIERKKRRRAIAARRGEGGEE
jgi:hypothetical protein